MAALTRRRTSRNEETEERDERPARRRRDSDESEDRPTRRRRTSSGDDKGAGVADEPVRRKRGAESEDDRPKRGRRSRSEDEGGSRRRRASSGFSSYAEKKRSGGGGDFAEDFRPGKNNAVLIKILDEEPFDSYNQHWIDEMPRGERKSYVCRDDEFFEEDEDFEDGCPLCDIGDNPKTYALFNVLDLSNPRKPEVKVWSASPAVTDHLARAAEEKKTSPLNRDDLYWEVELIEKNKRMNWSLQAVKARDLPEDFDMEPLDAEELREFEQDRYEDRTAVTKIDTAEELADLADSL